MSGGPQTNSQSNSIMQPWKPAQQPLKGVLGQANAYLHSKNIMRPTKAEKGAYSGIMQNAQTAEGYMPMQQGLIGDLYAGGGFGEGKDYITNSMDAAEAAYQPYLQSNYLDPMSNPYLQPALEAARSGAINSVGDRFAAAGRSFSGAHAGALGEGITNAALPMLLNQYNQNVGAQQNAAQGYVNSGIGASGALDSTAGNTLKAQMAAPGQIQNLNIPENMILDAAGRRRQQKLMALQTLGGIISPIGGMGGITSGTGTTQQYSDPFQTMLGGGLGLLGMLGSI